MSRGKLDKVTILARVLRLKNDLYSRRHDMKNEAYQAANHELNLVLDIINEYYQ